MALSAPARRPGFTDGAPGERVVFHERRRPPLLAALLVPAAVLATLAATDVALPVRAAAALAAAALVLLGVRLRRRVWMEDLLVTDRRIVVAPRAGAPRWLPLDEVESAVERGLAMRFTARDGEALSFAYVRDLGALRRALADARPDLHLRADDGALCRTCGIRF
jgi:hypothetical protein